MADEKRTVVLDFEVDIGDNEQSIQQLVKANKALREERNKLNTQTDEGRKKIADLNAAIDKNNSTIKANSSALEKQRQNVGNYAGAIDRLVPGLGQIAAGLENMAGGFLSSAKAALAFIATPIGAVLAAIVAVFGLLKAALSQNDELMDKFENVTNAVSVALEIVVNRVAMLGEALIALAQGNFSEAIDKTTKAFTGLGDEIANAVKQQQLFLDGSRRLEESQLALSAQTAKYENEIKRLVVAAKNRNLTFDEQEVLLRKSLALEEELVKTRTDLARQDLVITARTLRASAEFQQQENENFDQYIQRLISSEKLGYEEKKKIVDKQNALEEARGSSLVFQEKQLNSIAAIEEKRDAAIAKQNAEIEKNLQLQDEERRRAMKLAEDLQHAQDIFSGTNQETEAQKRNDALTNELITGTTLKIKFNKDTNDAIAKENAEFRKNQEDADQQALISYEEQQKRKVRAVRDTISNTAAIFDQESAAYKILASARALIDTWGAAVAALRSGSEINPLFGIISAAAATAAGLANVARINNVQFAEGGYTGQGSRLEPAGIVHKGEYVVPKWQVENPQYSHHLAALESGRLRPYADGGIVANGIVGSASGNIDIMAAIRALPAPVVSVKEINTIQKRVEVKEAVSQV